MGVCLRACISVGAGVRLFAVMSVRVHRCACACNAHFTAFLSKRTSFPVSVSRSGTTDQHACPSVDTCCYTQSRILSAHVHIHTHRRTRSNTPAQVLAGTIQFSSAIQAARAALAAAFPSLSVPSCKPLSPGEVLGCTAPVLTTSADAIVFVADGRCAGWAAFVFGNGGAGAGAHVADTIVSAADGRWRKRCVLTWQTIQVW